MIDLNFRSPQLTIDLLGPMRVLVGGQPLPPLRSRKALWMLALLVLRAGRPVEREWLAGTLWPDILETRAASNLRVVLSELRQALGSEGLRLLSPSRHTLSFDLEGAVVDLQTFDSAVESQNPSELRRAVAIYRGPLLEGRTEEWAAQERRARERSLLKALQTLADAALTANDYKTAAGYCQQAISVDPWLESAQRGLMVALSRDGDSNAAMQVYQSFTRLLRKDDPKASPDEKTQQLYARLRTEARKRATTPPPTAVEDVECPSAAGYLPHPLTEIVGREDERNEVTTRLRRSRLVTLTGLGGIGKTRLAIEVAAESASEYADGAWLITLEALSDGAHLVRQVCEVLHVEPQAGKRPIETLTAYLSSRRLLLVLDNCEHLLDACAQLAAHLLRESTGVRILATSREALGIVGETAWAVPALAVPDPAHLPTGSATLVRVLSGYESVQLFVERAQAVQKNFTLNGENALSVARICARLDGIPLAIELAAARMNVLSVQQIEARLDDHLALLKGSIRTLLPRHKTLRATLDWSYDLLNGAERLVFERLSVFAGGWDLDAAEHVCAGEGVDSSDILDLLGSLTDKSLVIFAPESNAARGRYRLLETIRQYAAERLAANLDVGGAEPIRARHRAWMVHVVEKFDKGYRGPEMANLTRRLETEYDNLRTTLAWEGAVASDKNADLMFMSRLRPFWETRGLYAEGRAYLERALSREGASAATGARAAALKALGSLCNGETDYAASRPMLTESLGIYRAMGDKRSIASVLYNLSNIAQGQGDYEAATGLLEESLQNAREAGDEITAGVALTSLGNVYFYQGDHQKVRIVYEESIRVFRKAGYRPGLAAALNNLGINFENGGDLATARAMQEESLSMFRDMGLIHSVGMVLVDLGRIEQKRGIYTDAQNLFEEAHRLSTKIGNKQGIRVTLTALASSAYLRGEYHHALSLNAEALRICRDIGAREAFTVALRQISLVTCALGFSEKAVRLIAAARSLRDSLGVASMTDDLEHDEQMIAKACGILGGDSFAAAWATGAAMTWEQAADFALQGQAPAESGLTVASDYT